jgi:hypothetical protein
VGDLSGDGPAGAARNDPVLYFFEARAKILAKQPAEAMPLLETAYQMQTAPFQRRRYVETVVRELYAAGEGLRAYRAAPDQGVAFETLAAALVRDKNINDLAALLAMHDKHHAGAGWLAYYRGELALLSGRPEQAVEAFAAAVAKAPAAQQWTFRRGLDRAQVRAGKTIDAYRAAGLDPRTFADLAAMCVEEKNAPQLTALIAVHREADPGDPSLPEWELDSHWLTQDYEKILTLLAAPNETLPRAGGLAWKLDSYRVRSLVKLKRTAEAVREAEVLVKQNRPNGALLLVLAHAAAGDVQQAIAAVEHQPSPERFLLSSCYKDADLGPLLRSEPMRPFRERYPEPKQ